MFYDQDGTEMSMQEFMKRLTGEDVTQEESPEPENDGFRANRAHLVELVIDNLGENDWTADEVVQSADTLFQYIMTGKVPE